MNFRQKLHQILIVLYVLVRRLTRHRDDLHNQTGTRVLIIFQQLFGDAIILQDSLKEYIKVFPKSEGYNITLLVRPSVAQFMQDIFDLPEEIKIETVDFKRFLENFFYCRKIVKKYDHSADILIIPGTSLSGEIFSASSDADRKVGLVRCFDVKKPFIMAIFSHIAYTEIVRPAKEEMMLQRHRLLLHYLGDVDFKSGLPILKKKEKIIHEHHYCVVCPGGSKKEKCWPTENYAQIIDFIIEKYDMSIHLCGGPDEKDYEAKIRSLVHYPQRIKSHIGKTNFSDWSAIIQYADLVVGNDSATMHLAAASRRKAICIAGVYDKFQFFPYKIDRKEVSEILPVTICIDMPCQWCRTVGYNAGYGNEKCKRRIYENKCALCIENISVNEVIKQIEKIMQ